MRKPALTRLFSVTIAALTLSAHALAIELPEVASVPGGVAVLELPDSETPPGATFNGKPVMVLEGPIRDQAELIGVLNALYQRHLTLLSVEYLNGD